jgi:hypothetical protein
VLAAAARSAVWVRFFKFESQVLSEERCRCVLGDQGFGKVADAVGTQLIDLENIL